MGKGAALRWMENRIIARHLHGKGAEIGALWRRFPVPASATTWYVDRIDPEELRQEYPEVGKKLVAPDIVAEGAELPFRDGSLDFLIASHVLEHMPFPLSALKNWYRVLAPDGVLVLKIPDKRYTFDIRRQRTPLEHLIAEESNHEQFDKRAHFAEWVEHVVGREHGSEGWEHETNRLMEMDYSIHYHAWIDEDVRELLEYTRQSMRFDWECVLFLPARFYRKECAVVLRRGKRG
jgi:predicted SAM-dependent methyltransferase